MFSCFFLCFICVKCYKFITVQYYIVNCVSWVSRLILLDLPIRLMNMLSKWKSFICRELTVCPNNRIVMHKGKNDNKCYHSMHDLKKHYAVWKKPVIQDLILWLYLYEMFRIGKSLRWKSRLVFARGLEKDKYRMMLLNCGAGEDSWKSLGLQGGQTRKLKGNQPWIFTWRTDVKAEAAILWPPSAKSQLTRCEESTLMLEKINHKRRRGWQRMR